MRSCDSWVGVTKVRVRGGTWVYKAASGHSVVSSPRKHLSYYSTYLSRGMVGGLRRWLRKQSNYYSIYSMRRGANLRTKRTTRVKGRRSYPLQVWSTKLERTINKEIHDEESHV